MASCTKDIKTFCHPERSVRIQYNLIKIIKKLFNRFLDPDASPCYAQDDMPLL
jgi:hypothetical protein